MCKRLKFDHADKWYRHKPESVLKMRHEILSEFDIQTDCPIPAKRSDQVLINNKKRTCQQVDITVPADHKVKMNVKRKDKKILGSWYTAKTLWNMKVAEIPIGAFRMVLKGMERRLGEMEIRVRIKTIQIAESARILRRVLET